MPTFLNSHSFTVSGGVFTDVVVQNNGSGLQSLYNSAALGASYDSSERYPPPKCHPQTRQHILRIIMEWVGNRNRARHILWLNGPAGAGKSSIAQTVAETCAERRQLAGGFFFSRNTPGRNDASRLVNTLAYQIAISVPRLKEIIGQVIQEDPSVLSKSLGSQFRALIVDPLKKWALPCDPPASDEDSEEPIPPQLVIVDGLDECADDRIQQDIIALISESAATHHLPLCFLIASRPEPHIRDAFMRSVPQDILQRITLDKSFLPDRDIRIFLQTGFADIYEKHWELMKSVPLPWPSDEVLTHLVSTASGQFIYASTVLKFVDNKFTRPTRQLAVVLDKSCPRPTAFEAMDQLYSSIVSTNPDTESVLRILGAVLILTDQASISVIEGLLGLEAGDVALTLNGLHSLLHVPQRSSQCITFYHASLPDFLLDATRSRNFYIDAAFHHSCISRSCIRMVKSWSNSLAPESRFFGDVPYDGYMYALKHWPWHVCHSQIDGYLFADLRDLDIKRSLEAYRTAGRISGKLIEDLVSMIKKIKSQFPELSEYYLDGLNLLYHRILAAHPRKHHLQVVLDAFLQTKEPVPFEELEQNLPGVDVVATCAGLHALFVTNPGLIMMVPAFSSMPARTLHKSFAEFLIRLRRAGETFCEDNAESVVSSLDLNVRNYPRRCLRKAGDPLAGSIEADTVVDAA